MQQARELNSDSQLQITMSRLRIMFVVSDAYGSSGGVAQFNKDFLRALSASTAVDRVFVVPRVVREHVDEEIPDSVIFDRAAAKNGFNFVRRVIVWALRGKFELIICGHLHLLPFAWVLAKVHGARLAMIVHGIEAWTPSKHRSSNWLSSRLDSILSVSSYSAKRFVDWTKASKSAVRILPNCVDLTKFKPGRINDELLNRYGLANKKVILTVGRMDPAERYKGFDEIIEILPDLSRRFDVKYLIVGEGADIDRLRIKADAVAPGRVVFAGRIAEQEKVDHYNVADVFVMPSSGEGFGIVLIEAAACGVAVIGSRLDGSREALLDGRLGRLVDPRSRGELLTAVSSTLEVPPSRQRLAGIEAFGVEAFFRNVDEWLLQSQFGDASLARK